MRDFPPVVPGFTSAVRQPHTRTDAGDPDRAPVSGGAAGVTETRTTTAISTDPASASGNASGATGQLDTRGATRFLFWVLRQQWEVLLVGSLLAVVWLLPGSLGPYLVGRAVDQGILQGSPTELISWSGLLLGVIVVAALFGVLGHTLVVRGWLLATYGTIKLVSRKSSQLGHVLGQRTPAGEVLSISTSDGEQFGALSEVTSRAIGSVIAFGVVAGIVLNTSPTLGILVLVAAPVLVLIAMPLLRPLQSKQTIERNRTAKLTSMATDIVAGLRILRGVGGERTFGENYAEQSQSVRRAGVAAGVWHAVTDAMSVLFSGIFLVSLTWIGALQVLNGNLTVGELVSFFGYALFVVGPIRTFFELAQKAVRAQVAATKAVAMFEQEPPWTDPEQSAALPIGDALTDERSGFVAEPGRLTMVVSAMPDQSAALADRLGRYLAVDHEPVSLDVDEKLKGRAAARARTEREQERRRLMIKDREQAGGRWGVRLGEIDLNDAAIDDVRDTILVSDTRSQLFAGTLQEAIDPHARLSLADAERAMRTAAAEDVYDALPGGWQGVLDERGRGLSGGQRQRLVLARALAVDAPVLILVEPTSAVDAHTEAMIAERLADHRRDRTTVVMSASPLLLHHADRVALMIDDTVVAVGTHEDLLMDEPRYRRVVNRAMEEDETAETDETSDTEEPARP